MKKMISSKKGFTVGQMLPLAIVFIVLAIGLGLGAQVLGTIQAGQAANSFAFNASQNGLVGLNTFSSYLPTIALVVVAAVVIGILVVYLARRMQ